MDIANYFQKARSVAIYPESAAFYYPTLGLVGEFGELTEKIERHGFAVVLGDFTHEMGDCLWYVVNLVTDLGFAPHHLVDKLTGGSRADNFTELSAAVVSRNIVGLGDVLVPIGKIAEIAKKAIRDTDHVVSDEKKAIVLEALATIVTKMIQLCVSYGVNLDDVAEQNIDKLFSRKERGVLRGSGDNR